MSDYGISVPDRVEVTLIGNRVEQTGRYGIQVDVFDPRVPLRITGNQVRKR